MIKINSITFNDEYTGVNAGGSDNGVPYLMGNVGDLIWATIDFYIQWQTLDSNIDFDSVNKTITRKDCGAVSGSFIQDGFQKGDTIIISGSSVNDGTYTITDVTSLVITVSQALNDASDTGVNIYGVTLVNYFDFYYNLIPNESGINFNSLTDSKAVQKFSGTSNPYYYGSTFSLNPNSTSQAWWNNKISGVNSLPVFTDYGYTDDHKQHFTVTFPFLISPFFKANQLALIQNSFKQSEGSVPNSQDFDVPDYFSDTCLKFIYQIDAKFKITNTKVDHSSNPQTTFDNGNTSWFNTFFPTGVYLNGHLLTKQQYDLVSIAYTDNSSNVLDSIDINNPTNVTVKIKRVGSETISNEKFVLNFMWLPTDSTKYQGYSQNNQSDFRQVFLHDRCKTSVGAGATNGDQFGTSVQAITTVVGSAIDADNFQVTFKIDLGSLSKSVFTNDGTQNRNYLIWISPQSNACTALDESNRSAIICDVNQAFLNTDNSALLTVTTGGTTDTHYFKYPDTYINPTTNYKGFAGDIGLLRNNFKIPANCIIENVSVITEVQILNSVTGAIIDTMQLDSWVNQTSQYFNGVFTDFSLSQDNGFLLPNGDLRNQKVVRRTPNMDTAGYYSYEIVYGFQLGFQYWQNITKYPQQLSAFHNQYWPVYTQQGFGAGKKDKWIPVPQGIKLQIAHKIIWNITEVSTGVTTEFIQYSNIFAYDDVSNQSGNSIRIDTFTDLGESLNGVIAKDIPTTITAYLSGNFTIPDGSTDIIGELSIYYQDGNNSLLDSINTLMSSIPEGSVWTSLPTIAIDVTNQNGVVTSTLDFSNKNNVIRNIVLYCRISYKTDNGLLTSTSRIQIQTDSGTDITPTNP